MEIEVEKVEEIPKGEMKSKEIEKKRSKEEIDICQKKRKSKEDVIVICSPKGRKAMEGPLKSPGLQKGNERKPKAAKVVTKETDIKNINSPEKVLQPPGKKLSGSRNNALKNKKKKKVTLIEKSVTVGLKFAQNAVKSKLRNLENAKFKDIKSRRGSRSDDVESDEYGILCKFESHSD